eukprot:CAMPEP_0182911472 /NCGR_PEP_ID=MMETSP0034_2-20130328/36943_1 /TAXON_ID=156128 /ORGANISM="Nephroselmis pyriformis, Strain CCMP717" /LENGTH=189 /DNA_ID=CAMNT_0025047997 /DNA_START=453 /DNA_END=1019 /DNA_ORIENTATION=-
MDVQAELESLKEKLALLEKRVPNENSETYDANFQPEVFDSMRLAKDAQSGGLCVVQHQENPYPVGREPGQKTNPMVMSPEQLSQLPAIQQLMRACCNNPNAYAHLLEEIPVSYVTLSYLYDVLMMGKEYLDLRGDDEEIPETVEVDRDDLVAMFNTLNAVMCLNVPPHTATRPDRATELGVEQKILRTP